MVNVVMLKPLSYPNADRIVEFLSSSFLVASSLACVPQFHFYRRHSSVFQEVAAYDAGGPGFNITGQRQEQVNGLHVKPALIGVVLGIAYPSVSVASSPPSSTASRFGIRRCSYRYHSY